MHSWLGTHSDEHPGHNFKSTNSASHYHQNAFLRGILQDEVYIGQPLGFVDSQKSTYICKLHKSFYGLKQASRAWNERFTSFLSSLGFLSFYANSSLFEKCV